MNDATAQQLMYVMSQLGLGGGGTGMPGGGAGAGNLGLVGRPTAFTQPQQPQGLFPQNNIFGMVGNMAMPFILREFFGLPDMAFIPDMRGMSGIDALISRDYTTSGLNRITQGARQGYHRDIAEAWGVTPSAIAGLEMAGGFAGALMGGGNFIHAMTGGDRAATAGQMYALGGISRMEAGPVLSMFNPDGSISTDFIADNQERAQELYEQLMDRNFTARRGEDGEILRDENGNIILGATQNLGFSRGFRTDQQAQLLDYMLRRGGTDSQGQDLRGADAATQIDALDGTLQTLSELGDMLGTEDMTELIQIAERFSQGGNFARVDQDAFRENLRNMAATARVLDVDGREFMNTAATVQQDLAASIGFGLTGNANALMDASGQIVGGLNNFGTVGGVTSDIYTAASMSGDMSQENITRLTRNSAALATTFFSSEAGRQAVLVEALRTRDDVDQEAYEDYARALQDGNTYEAHDHFNRIIRSSSLTARDAERMLRNPTALRELALIPEVAERLPELYSHRTMVNEGNQRTREMQAAMLLRHTNELRSEYMGGRSGVLNDEDATRLQQEAMAQYLEEQGLTDEAAVLRSQRANMTDINRFIGNREAVREHLPRLQEVGAAAVAENVLRYTEMNPETIDARLALESAGAFNFEDREVHGNVHTARRKLENALRSGDPGAVEDALSDFMSAFPEEARRLVQGDIESGRDARYKELENLSRRNERVKSGEQAPDIFARVLAVSNTASGSEPLAAAEELMQASHLREGFNESINSIINATTVAQEEKLQRSQTFAERFNRMLAGEQEFSVMNLAEALGMEQLTEKDKAILSRPIRGGALPDINDLESEEAKELIRAVQPMVEHTNNLRRESGRSLVGDPDSTGAEDGADVPVVQESGTEGARGAGFVDHILRAGARRMGVTDDVMDLVNTFVDGDMGPVLATLKETFTGEDGKLDLSSVTTAITDIASAVPEFVNGLTEIGAELPNFSAGMQEATAALQGFAAQLQGTGDQASAGGGGEDATEAQSPRITIIEGRIKVDFDEGMGDLTLVTDV